MRKRGKGKGEEREGGRVKTSIAARLQIHGKPPHEGYWQRLSISVEVLNQREGAQREREGGGCGERHRKKGKQGGGGGGGEWGEQVVQSVESYISSPWLLRRIGFI